MENEHSIFQFMVLPHFNGPKCPLIIALFHVEFFIKSRFCKQIVNDDYSMMWGDSFNQFLDQLLLNKKQNKLHFIST